MKHFFIKELERLAGVKAHTIRVWEKRYGLFTPQRNKGNFRFYTVDQVKSLLDITQLVGCGYRISRVSQMGPEERFRVISGMTGEEAMQRRAVCSLIIFMFRLEIEAFEDLLDSCILFWGIDGTLSSIILPFLQKTQILSYQDNSCEIHFAVTVLRKKIIMAIEKQAPKVHRETTALLFLPPNEYYDLVLLYMSYLLKREGISVLYLGTNISLENLQLVLRQKYPELLFTYLPPKVNDRQLIFLRKLEAQLITEKLFITVSDYPQKTKDVHKAQWIHYKDAARVLRNEAVVLL